MIIHTNSIDRFWRIEPTGYTTKPALNNLIFTYRDLEHTVANNSIIESNLIAQRYNGSLNSWDDYMPATTINTVSNTATSCFVAISSIVYMVDISG
jgi:hypothetical protein